MKAVTERLGAGVDIVQAASRAYGQMRGAADQAINVWRSRPPGLDEEQTRTLANQVNDSLNKVKSGYDNVLRSYAGAYLAQLGGADVISFTAGVGENAPHVREAALETLGFAGVALGIAPQPKKQPSKQKPNKSAAGKPAAGKPAKKPAKKK